MKGDGTVWAWGANTYGALGNCTTDDSSTPVRVRGLTGVTAISGSRFSGYALGNPPIGPCNSDSTPPVITPTITGTAGANGWYTGPVTVSWSTTDPESGIATSTGCATQTLTTDTPGTTLTCSAKNGDGLANSITVTVKVDKTPPLIVPTITGTLGANGFYTSDVTVTWSASDPDSSIATSSGCATTTLTANTPGTTLTCSATNGAGLSTSVPVTIKIDKSAPLITPTITGTLGTNGWYTGNVTVSWTTTDPESGIATSAGCASQTLTANTPGTTLTCSATNGAGLANSAQVTIKIDKSAPTISGMPGAGCNLWPPNHKMVQVATVTTADLASGIAPGTFAVTGLSNEPGDPNDPDVVITPNGAGGYVVRLRAERLGTGTGRIYSLTATAKDLAGNTVTALSTCTVPHDQGQ